MTLRNFCAWLLLLCASPAGVRAEIPSGQLYVGSATISITPDERVALSGQMRLRVSSGVESPCMATALAVETRKGEESLEQAIFVSCDLVSLRGSFYSDLRQKLQGRIPDSVLPKIMANATHTHTGPEMEEGRFILPESGVMHPGEYRDFLMDQLAKVVVQAWESRVPGQVAWGLGYAVIAHNRRAVYADGSAAMYGKTNNPKFRGIEGSPDPGVEILYFWDAQDKLVATAINVSCPSQEVENGNYVNADYWHEVRENIRKKHGAGVNVVAWCGSAGDQSPHLIYRKAAEQRMQKLRGINALQDLGQRIASTWEDVLSVVQKDKHSNLLFEHRTAMIHLPSREITQAEAAASQQAADAIKDKNRYRQKLWYLGVVDRFNIQQAGKAKDYEMELHAIRLGDIAIVTNDFELFTDYGVQIKARSPALQTFVIQLSGGGSYLPTERAIAGGSYSAIPQSNRVGPPGGQVLVDESVKLIQSLWPAPTPKK